LTRSARSLAGRSVIVTGAARGIGYGIAEVLAAAGARVVILDLDGEQAMRAAADLSNSGAEAIGVEADVTITGSVESALATTLDRFGNVDGLVNNAGLIRMASVLDVTEDEWRLHYDVNLHSVFLVSRLVARAMIEHGTGGSIVNVASNAGKVGYPNMAAYNATKAGVISLTRSLASEWAEHDINVNCVCPGGVDTPMLDGVAAWLAEKFGGEPTDMRSQMVPAQLGRHVQPVEVGRVVAFLLSDDAAIIRGQAINTDGGDTPY
jgi:NAD(P)-dependent dehydrogenase (short-subunit alcohol dehydrogenase family)